MRAPNALRKVCIVGGGTAGWIAAAVMAHHFKGKLFEIELVESDDIGTIGVGESTIPPFMELIARLDINEQDFVRATQASFKLGIEFEDWHRKGESYFHPFGAIGQQVELSDFYQCWLKAKHAGQPFELMDFAPAAAMARDGRFMLPFKAHKTPIGGAAYALHVDAKRVAQFLRAHAEERGVKRTEGIVSDVRLDDRGFVDTLTLNDGREVSADFFIDCSGFRALLIGKALGVGYEDWSEWLFCDRAIAAQTQNVGAPRPYTLAQAQDYGWRWRIPLQHRTGNGHVFCSEFLSDDEATRILLDQVEGEVVAGPMVVPFKTGVRDKIWHKNVLSLGLASGFIEPLESTAIHLVYRGMDFFFRYLPDRNCDPRLAAEYNRRMTADYVEIRDFIVLHYCATQRDDTPFWRKCRDMTLPDSLRERIELFRTSGVLREGLDELFRAVSWQSVLEGMGIHPASYHPLVDRIDEAWLFDAMDKVRSQLGQVVATLPTHQEFIDAHCRADAVDLGQPARPAAAR
ncbi:tryptophan halogenase [Sphingomonas naasensis]|uniref:Tryptophan 7-halogenase n=1 Tax=Sphingomonas naasensis TaxID=1344951 RepID=A0A4S1WJB3_9SPHN|nr:tryptophan halogenase family protein [Sphingomonas naasensis]NIJ20886.1 tryptophan halogenase [Sphingomonas naasensis]TGX43278.1 tryptophan 7-halogenase [Sphingomonas naasensis]